MKENNTPAFPSTWDSTNNPSSITEAGMSLRDYFAAQAITGLLTNEYTYHRGDENLAEKAYKVADAMLKQREL